MLDIIRSAAVTAAALLALVGAASAQGATAPASDAAPPAGASQPAYAGQKVVYHINTRAAMQARPTAAPSTT